MALCSLYPQCGGCKYCEYSEDEYRKHKYETFKNIIQNINQDTINYGEPIFISSGTRRRATMAFSNIKKQFKLGFNASKSHEIIDCKYCPILSQKLNDNLGNIRTFLQELCSEPYSYKKGKKLIKQGITNGDISLCDADNGIDITLELPFIPELNHRMIISENICKFSEIIRVSWRTSSNAQPETIVEKIKPIIHNSGYNVYISAGTFLQASKEGEQALINLVLKYIGDKQGKIADLFCGIGTFSYPLAQNKNNTIWAIDSSQELLNGFQSSVNKNQISNIKIEAKNLFKYPLDEKDLSSLDIVVFDPPRAGAKAQVEKLATCSHAPSTVIAVSCNPHSFVNDANTLLAGGYTMTEITMVDQFIYSGHTELVALFEKRNFL